MKKFIIQASLLLIIIGVGILFFSPTGSPKNLELPFLPQRPKFMSLQINDKSLKVEVADTAAKRKKGLGGRTNLVENEGMLFVFERADKHPFWMKGLTFPLDFVWIRGSEVVDILENIPPPTGSQPDSELPIYSSKVEVDEVLELNAGTVKRLDIKEGDTVRLIPL